jgi:hypothetical protein
MFNKFTCAIILLILSGCASTENIPIDIAHINATKPQTITTTIRVKPDFYAETPGKVVLTALFVNKIVAAGNEIIYENSIADPAGYISNELAEALSAKLNLEKISNNGKITYSPNPNLLSKAYSHSDLLLDIQTLYWGFTYFRADLKEYRVLYTAKLRLVDTRSSITIAEGVCYRRPDQDEHSPSYTEMLSDKAVWIKRELIATADYCISEFKTNVLKI